MRTEPLRILVAGTLGIAIAGCSDSGDQVTTTPGTTGGTSSTGGAGAGGGLASGGAGQTGSGGTTSTGGSAGVAGAGGTGGAGGSVSSGGASTTGGAGTGGAGAGSSGAGKGGGAGMGAGGGSAGASAAGGTSGSGGMSGGGSGGAMTTGGASGAGGSGGGNPGTCTASKATGSKASGSGPHQVTVETNSGPGIDEGTIFRPTDLGGTEKYPIFVWGEGGCSQNGLSNQAAMAEIASHGYFVVADGAPNGSGSRSSGDVTTMAEPLLAYIEWAIAENGKPCSAYYQSLDTTKVAANGFSCGGLMAEGTAGNSRMTTWGITSSGMFSASQALYQSVHTPVLIVLGGPSDIAYENGVRDYENISTGDQPVLFFSKDIGHGGDLFSARGGDFTKINLAWLNWWLKGDVGATGKGLLVGAGCPYCSDSAWEVQSANVP